MGCVVITQLQPITVVFAIPEDSLPRVMKKLRAGEKLTVEAYDREQKVKLATGSLLTVDNQIDPTTGTVRLKAVFDNEDNALFANQFVNARLLLDMKKDATVVPTVAIQRGTQGAYVYVVKEDQTVAARPVTVGALQGDDASIEKGISPGELVVVDGADKLKDGSKVEISKGEAKARRIPTAKASRESFAALHRAAGRNFAVDGRAAAGRCRGLPALPVSALPQVDYPTIQVVTFYPGASPDVMASSVTAPLERQFGQVPGLNQMTSSSSGGSSVITLQFSSGPQHRRGRAGSAGGDQCGLQLPADAICRTRRSTAR